MTLIRTPTQDAHAEHFARCYRICVELLPDVWGRLGWTPASRTHGLDILHASDVLTGVVMRAGTSIAEGRVTQGLGDLTASIARVKELDPVLWNTRACSEEVVRAVLLRNGCKPDYAAVEATRTHDNDEARRLVVEIVRRIESAG